MRKRLSWGAALLALISTALVLVGAASARTTATPTISSFAPTQAMHGQKVTIYGSGFTGATAVDIGGVPAQNVTVVSDTHITALIGAEATTGSSSITVTTPDGAATSSQLFNVLPAGAVVTHSTSMNPKITKVSPARGRSGTHITITGLHLNGALWVKLAGMKIRFTVPSTTRVVAVLPKNAHSGRLTVRTNYGTAMSPGRFTVTAGGVLGATK